MRVLAISGSLRAGSHNTALLKAAADLAPEGVEIELYDGLESLPPYNQDRDTDVAPIAVADLRHRIAAADALLFATPEFNGSIPGQLKDAIDWASRPRGTAALRGKNAAVIGSSVSEYGALWAAGDLHRVLGIAGARVFGEPLTIGKVDSHFGENGELIDGDTRESLSELLEGLAAELAVTAAA
jgi:chromate reductase